MRPGSLLRHILERAPLALFLLALAVGLIVYGVAIERYGVFPGAILDSAGKTARTTVESLQKPDLGRFREFSDTPLDDFAARRLDIVEGESLTEALLIYGGRHQFRELCPEHGCLAVAVDASGEIVHAWPFRPNALQAANIADERSYPYELNNFSPEQDVKPAGIEQYPNGDLLVAFGLENAFPYAGGVARIARDGQPRWFRRDYSHHQPRLTIGDTALVPALTIGGDVLHVPYGDRAYACDGKVYRTVLNVLNGDGAVLERIPVLDILLASPWAAVLTEPPNPCDPLHLNSIDIIGGDADGGGGDAGDIVLSFRNISAFAILDGETHELKRLVRGTFHRQHDVTHLAGAVFLMFDNQTSGDSGGPSRLLMVDLASGAETTIFPNAGAPQALRTLYSGIQGSIDVSPDRRRATVAFAQAGVAVEVRLADGALLAVFRSLHDVSDLVQFPDERLRNAAAFSVQGMNYLRATLPSP